jgi:SAM-dependent methyltransferase
MPNDGGALMKNVVDGLSQGPIGDLEVHAKTEITSPYQEQATAKTIAYSFQYAEQCNMCGSPTASHSILGRRLNTRQGFRPQKKIGIATTVMKCTRCGLIYPNPMPIPDRLDQHYGIPPESYWKDEYFVADPDYIKGQIDLFEKLFGRKIRGADLKALDVGAGIGKGMIALSNAGFNAFGVEPSESFYRRAIGRMGVSDKCLQLATIEEANFDENSFDFINMGAVVEHFFDPAGVIIRALRWLKPGGLLHIEVPSSGYLMSKLARWFYRLTGSDYVVNICPMHAPFHLYEFTAHSFQLHAERNNYQIVHHDYYVCESYMPKIVKPLFNAVMRATNSGMQLAVWLKNPD